MNGCKNNSSLLLSNPISQIADIPYPLYLSLQGKYFVGYADDMEFSNNTIAWAGLINPPDSKINLYVYVWTVTNTGNLPLKADIWLNTKPLGQPTVSELVTPANTAICPMPRPKTMLLEASNVQGHPTGGINILERPVEPEVTLASDSNGVLIFPPGGALIITLSYTARTTEQGLGRVAFGWSEEQI